MSMKGVRMESSRLVVDLEERVSCLDHAKPIPFGWYVEDQIIKVRDADSFRCWNVAAQVLKNRKQALALYHNLSGCSGAYVSRFRVSSQKIREIHVFHDALYTDIDKVNAVIFFKRLHVAQKTLHRVSGRCFVSHDRSRNISEFTQFGCISRQNDLAVYMKCVTHARWLGRPRYAIFNS